MNSVNLVGRLSRAPIVRFEGDGRKVTTFTLQIQEPGRDGTAYTLYVNCVAWGKTAEAAGTLEAESGCCRGEALLAETCQQARPGQERLGGDGTLVTILEAQRPSRHNRDRTVPCVPHMAAMRKVWSYDISCANRCRGAPLGGPARIRAGASLGSPKSPAKSVAAAVSAGIPGRGACPGGGGGTQGEKRETDAIPISGNIGTSLSMGVVVAGMCE